MRKSEGELMTQMAADRRQNTDGREKKTDGKGSLGGGKLRG